MSNILLSALITGLVIFVGPFASSPMLVAALGERAPETAGQSQSSVVEVTFDGLMVFREVEDHYEVGILDENTAKDHKVRITVGGKEIPETEVARHMKSGNFWRLDVKTSSGDTKKPDIETRRKKGCRQRLQDTADEHFELDRVFDFCWIMDFESREFHDGKLKLYEGKLKPIIRLFNGELYTKYKYDELLRRQGPTGDYSPFGFVAETIALKIKLEVGESVVLRVHDKEEPIARFEAGVSSTLGIYNAPKVKKGGKYESHFHYYYDLFDGLTDKQKFDIQPKPRGLSPLNPFPHAKSEKKIQETLAKDDQIRIVTYDNQTCGAAFLGRTRDALK